MLATFGATEAIAAALLGPLNPGDEVVVLEPYHDSYAACIAFAGARRRPVTLRPPEFALDIDALQAAAGPRAQVLLLNTPHNPTERVLSRGELEAIARVCIEHDLVCVSDEVYEHLVCDGEHVPIAAVPGMAQRTISSVGQVVSRSPAGRSAGAPAPRSSSRAGRQGVPDVRGWRAAPVRSRGRAAPVVTPPRGGARRATQEPRPALRGADGGRAVAADPGPGPISLTRTSAPARSSSG